MKQSPTKQSPKTSGRLQEPDNLSNGHSNMVHTQEDTKQEVEHTKVKAVE